MNCSKHPTTLHLESPGLGVSIQDRGRVGHRSIGVPVSGALDPLFLAAANALAGNPPDAAGLEVLLAGPLLRATGGRVRVAGIDGLTLMVTPIAAQSDAAASAPGPDSAAPDTHHVTPGSTSS